MTNNILILGEGRADGLRKVSFELITVAKKLAEANGASIEAALVGSGIDDWAKAYAPSGVAKVYVADDPALKDFAPETYAAALAEIIRRAAPQIILFGATGWGKELSARTAAKLDLGLATDCTDAEMQDGTLMLTRPIYAGKAIAHVKAKTLPVMVSIRPNIFPPVEMSGGSAPIEKVNVQLPEPRAKVVESVQKEKTKVDLSEASIVVSGGRGVKGPEGFIPLQELADTLGAALGASRAAVDAGWIDYTHQVGQTGKTVSPTVYIAAGISGAIQHLAGMSSSKVIVAINKDPDAPIFKIADYGIAADLFEVVPALKTEFARVLAEK
jgi:electron transfer flavoprotein alpha subunit